MLTLEESHKLLDFQKGGDQNFQCLYEQSRVPE